MRLVFVNYYHICYPHISAVRVRRFAEEMARRHHQVILLTRTLEECDPGTEAGAVAARIRDHDWSTPLHLACAPSPMPILRRLREAPRSSLHKKARICYEYALHGGMHHDWVKGARPAGQAIARYFRPDATWGTFVHLDTLWIGRAIARAAGAVWAIDIKDNWNCFVPAIFRHAIAARLRAADVVTANSRFHGDLAARWLRRPYTLIYSGISDQFHRASPAAAPGNYIFIGGSIYNDGMLAVLIEGIARWLATRNDGDARFELLYAGQDRQRVRDLLARHPAPFPVVIGDYLPESEYARLCLGAFANAYIWSPNTFHHKAADLFATGRPVIAVPGEHAETLELARRMAGRLQVCASAEAVALSLARLGAAPAAAGRPLRDRLDPFTWDAQADLLESTLSHAVALKKQAVRQGLTCGKNWSRA